MRFNSTLISSFLLASAVLADHGHHHRRSQFLNLQDSASDPNTNTTGVVLTEANRDITSITGTFTVPEIHGKNGSAAVTTVILDPLQCDSSFSVGIDFIVRDNRPVYQAYYTWIHSNGAGSGDYFELDVDPGDDITLTVEAHSPTSGVAKIKNHKTNVFKEQALQNAPKLCRGTAGWLFGIWIAEYPHATLPDFGEVTITDSKASSHQRTYKASDGGKYSPIKQNGHDLTRTTVSGSSITFKHV